MNASYSRTRTGTGSAGLDGVGLAFGRALKSQFRGPMLMALLLPFAVALLGAIVLLWLFWTPLTEWLQAALFSWPLVNELDGVLIAVGIASIKLWLIPVVATLILLPLSGILGLVVSAVVVMPLVLRHLGARDYPDLARHGGSVILASMWNAAWVTVIFVAGWLLTLPLWLLPPLAIMLPVFWWTFAFTRMLRLDAMADHASAEERKALKARHNPAFWMLGLICSLLNLFPPAWLLLPVFSALLFSHFVLEALRRLRSETMS